jgi:hypothetical protein
MPKTLNEALHYDGPDQGIEQRIATSRGGTNNSFQQPVLSMVMAMMGQSKMIFCNFSIA